MKNKIKKMITATVISAISLTALGANSNSQERNNEGVAIQNYLATQDLEKASAYAPNKNIGKIVETSTDNQIKYISNEKQMQFLNNDINETEIENNITLSNQSDRLNLFVLSTTPYINFTNDNNEFNLSVKFSSNNTNELPKRIFDAEYKDKFNTYNLKRSILLIYANEIYNNNVNLSNQNKNEINTHIETISSLKDTKSKESLETKISALDSIINIIESNLTTNSTYYQKNINSEINTLLNSNQETIDKISETSSNQEIANKISCVLNGKCSSSETDTINTNQTKQRLINNNSSINTNQTNNQYQNTSTLTENQTNINENTNSNQTKERRRRRNRNRNKTNQNNNLTTNETTLINNQENLNNDLRNGTIMQETKTMRADRTNENISQEKYTNLNNQNDMSRASRMPYQSTGNFER